MLSTLDPAIADRFDLPRDLSLALKELQSRKLQFVNLARLADPQVAAK